MNTQMGWEETISFQVRESMAAFACGVVAIGFALFIFAMWMLHPSGRGGGVFLYLPLLCMAAGGAMCLVMYFRRKLSVEGMEIQYVNPLGRKKQFTLDEIGYCRIDVGGTKNMMVLYDLLGKKLCKLGIDMRGFAEFHQYLVDNGVRVEWNRERTDSAAMQMIDAVQREGVVCEEEIGKCSAAFYEMAEGVFREWEKRNKRFHAYWETGFAEYAAMDMEKKCRLSERTSSVEDPVRSIPISYVCILEAYLKCDEGYVVDRHNEEVSIVLPYLVMSRSYRIGEGVRIRKTDEQSMQDWLEGQLEALARELPRHKYHTEEFTLRHRLKKAAGIVAGDTSQSGSPGGNQ